MLHRIRSALIRPGRERLRGTVQVDEAFFGGEESDTGGRHQGKKVLVGIAVEVLEPTGFGRCRMATLRDASAGSLLPFIYENVEEGSTVVTDAWTCYSGIEDHGYRHQARSRRAARLAGEDIEHLLSGVHRVVSLAKRWLLRDAPGLDRQHPPPELPG